VSENGSSDAAIYARVSTSDQDVSRQVDEVHEHLERLGVKDIKEYPEIVSGAADTDTREVYNRLLDDVETRQFDLVSFTKSADFLGSVRLRFTSSSNTAWNTTLVSRPSTLV
jgi:DNA invertase Pin-like site-specific DNA recombinase